MTEFQRSNAISLQFNLRVILQFSESDIDLKLVLTDSVSSYSKRLIQINQTDSHRSLSLFERFIKRISLMNETTHCKYMTH